MLYTISRIIIYQKMYYNLHNCLQILLNCMQKKKDPCKHIRNMQDVEISNYDPKIPKKTTDSRKPKVSNLKEKLISKSFK